METSWERVRISDERLRFILSRLESNIEYQIDASESAERKAARLINVGLAAIAGGLTIAGYMAPRADQFPSEDMWVSAVALGVGLLLNFGALLYFLDAYVGLKRNRRPVFQVDMSPDWLEAWAQNDQWSREHMQYSLIQTLGDNVRTNSEKLQDLSSRRRAGLWLLILFGSGVRKRNLLVCGDPHLRMMAEDDKPGNPPSDPSEAPAGPPSTIEKSAGSDGPSSEGD